MPSLDFFFDFRSPYSYLAHSQLASLPAEARLIPIGVLDLMKLVNNTPTTITCPAKRAYAGQDLARWARRYGAPFKSPDFSALDGDLLLRIAVAAQAQGVGPQTIARLFAGDWGGVGDASPAGVEALLDDAGLPGAALRASAGEAAAAETLAANVQAAAEAGVFGAPTFRVSGELFFGNDRLDFVREALARTPEAA